jgi:hypothetical protein
LENYSPTPQNTNSYIVKKIKHLLLFLGINIVYSENRMKPINTPSEQIRELFYDEAIGMFPTTGFHSVRSLFAFISRADMVTSNINRDEINDNEHRKK